MKLDSLTTYTHVHVHVHMAAINTDMNERVCGALVQYGCFQHGHD
jgi:hypothetical protein